MSRRSSGASPSPFGFFESPGGSTGASAAPERDELEEYLSAPLETDIDLDLLAYWKLKESMRPKLAKMVKQYFAAPASSAGALSLVLCILHACLIHFILYTYTGSDL